MFCLRNYRLATCYSQPLVCVSCGRAQDNVATHLVSFNCDNEPPLIIKKLTTTDPYLLHQLNTNPECGLNYNFTCLNGLILCKNGISVQDDANIIHLTICKDCHSALSKNKLPRLALANQLYRGVLPDEFCDITWVEEMVCAIYRTTAHVIRLYESSEATQPFVYHGNSCAHEVNVVSTASVLPRTPGDINSTLTVVFIGRGKFDPKRMGPIMKV